MHLYNKYIFFNAQACKMERRNIIAFVAAFVVVFYLHWYLNYNAPVRVESITQSGTVTCPRNFLVDVDEIPPDTLNKLPPFNKQTFNTLFEPRNVAQLKNVLRQTFSSPDSTLLVIVLGGSETAGVNCNQVDKVGVACSWGSRVVEWLQRESGNKNIILHSLARGGTTSISILPVLRFMLGDVLQNPHSNVLVFIDYGANDAYETDDSFKQFGITTTQGISLAIEETVSIIKTLSPNAAIVGFDLPVRDHERALKIHLAYESTFLYHKIPSLRMGLLRWVGKPFWYWSGVHPTFEGHIFFANAITHAFTETLCDREMEPKLSSPRMPEKSALLVTCEKASSYYSAFKKTEMNEDSTCELYEDRPGKPGYICVDDQSMSFDIQFGASPRIMVTYLQSYTSIGDAKLTINGVSVLLSGKNTNHVSQTKTTFFYAERKENQGHYKMIGLQGFGVKPHSKHIARISSVDGNKIKIISLISC